MIHIISDSTCDLSPELIEKHNIHILPLHVLLGEDEFFDGVDITPDELYKWSDEHKKTPKTSAVSVGEGMTLFETMINNNDEILCFTISSAMSSAYNNLCMAADELNATDKISVIDSANLSTGIGLLVVEAAIMAEAGKPRQEIVAEIEQLKPMVHASFVVDTLTYLHRGGRCSSVAALAGGVLKLHPSIVVENGEMKVGKKYRGKYDKIILNYVADMKDTMLNAKPDRVFITHSGINQEIVDSVTAYLKELNHFDEIIVTRAGSVISSHCGYGTLGVLYI